MEMQQQAASAASSYAAPIPTHAPRAARTGWREEETQLLWRQVHAASEQGAPLREVFESVAAQLGRKPNSIRNYYYAQLKEHDEPALKRALPFETFSEDEVRALVRTVLQKKGEGMSVRACVTEMAGGDKSLILRYQNKYRSTLRARPELIREIMDELTGEGLPCANPYASRGEENESTRLLTQTQDRVRRTGESALLQMLEGMNALLDLAFERKDDATRAADGSIPALSDEACSRALLERDRLSARNDLLRIALDDEHTRRETLLTSCTQLTQTLRDFLAQSELARAQHLGEFCQTLTLLLPPLEQEVGQTH